MPPDAVSTPPAQERKKQKRSLPEPTQWDSLPPEEVMPHVLELLEFFVFARKEDSKYRGTLAFHFRGLPSGDDDEDERQQQQQQQPQQMMKVFSVRLSDGETVVYHGYPPDGRVSAHIHCGPSEFLFINSGKATARDLFRLGMQGRIWVSGFKVRDCVGFAESFHLQSRYWQDYYASGLEGTIRQQFRKGTKTFQPSRQQGGHHHHKGQEHQQAEVHHNDTATTALPNNHHHDHQKKSHESSSSPEGPSLLSALASLELFHSSSSSSFPPFVLLSDPAFCQRRRQQQATSPAPEKGGTMTGIREGRGGLHGCLGADDDDDDDKVMKKMMVRMVPPSSSPVWLSWCTGAVLMVWGASLDCSDWWDMAPTTTTSSP